MNIKDIYINVNSNVQLLHVNQFIISCYGLYCYLTNKSSFMTTTSNTLSLDFYYQIDRVYMLVYVPL